MDIEKSCICVFKGLKKFLTQVVSTGSYYLSTLDVNQSQDLPQVLLRHLSNYLRTVPPIHPLYSSQIDHPVPAPCSYECLVSFHYILPYSLLYRLSYISPQQEFPGSILVLFQLLIINVQFL